MANVKVIDNVLLPKTFATVLDNFESGPLCEAVWKAARTGWAQGLRKKIALTAQGEAGLNAVQLVLNEEWAAAGLDKYRIGDGDPEMYGDGVVVAFLDQPL